MNSVISKPVGVALIVVGAILLVWGFNAADSFSSEVSEFFSGHPTDKSMWLIIGGAAAAIVGLFLVAVPTRRRPLTSP
jgi:drug/metabolite transporter (DMT)-like permease